MFEVFYALVLLCSLLVCANLFFVLVNFIHKLTSKQGCYEE
jgi:hypothetical protein